MGHAGDPDRELFEHRPVEPELGADGGDLGNRRIIAGDDGRGIAGRKAQQEEHEHGDHAHHGDRRQQPAEDVREHEGASGKVW